MKRPAYQFNHLSGGIRPFIGPVTKYQDQNGNDYRDVFKKSWPIGTVWALEDETSCAMCDANIHPDDRGCIKCLGQGDK